MTWSTYHLLQNDIVLLLYCQFDSTLMKIFEKCSRILRDLFQDLWSSWWACQRSMKNLWRSSSGPLKLLKILSQIYEKSSKVFFRTFEALEDLFKALWKILEDLLQDLGSSLRSCQRSMKNPRGSFKLLRILSKMKNPWRYLKFLLRSLEIFHFHAKILNSSGGNNRSHYSL